MTLFLIFSVGLTALCAVSFLILLVLFKKAPLVEDYGSELSPRPSSGTASERGSVPAPHFTSPDSDGAPVFYVPNSASSATEVPVKLPR